MDPNFKRRAIITDHLDQVEITIPAKKNWLILLFMGVWLCGWAMGERFALQTLLSNRLGLRPEGLFLLVWTILWTAGGGFFISIFIWWIFGKEIITIGQGQLRVYKRGLIFHRTFECDLIDVSDIRSQQEYYKRYGNPRKLEDIYGGVIKFKCGDKNYKCATGIEEDEGTEILRFLKEKKILTEKNFAF